MKVVGATFSYVFRRPETQRQLAIPTVVTDAIRPYLRNLLDQVDGPIATFAIDGWWSDLLPADAITIRGADELVSGVTAVAVNRLRGLLPIDWLASHDSQLIYAEAARHFPRPFGSPRFGAIDVTGELWAAGLSTIDVHRPVIDTPDGRWELAIGRARPTP